MSTSAEPRVVHRAPGRVRVRWPRDGWPSGPDASRLLTAIEGASSVHASALTWNVLVKFDERVTTADRVLTAIVEFVANPANRADQDGREGRIHGRPTSTSPEAPPLVPPTARGKPQEPNAFELLERAARTAGALTGLCIVAARRKGANQLPAGRAGSSVAAGLALLEGYPALHAASGRVLGYRGRSAVLSAVGIVAHTASGSPLGLTIAALVALRQLFESRERRLAFHAYRSRSSIRAGPDSGRWTARLDDGDRCPAPGRISDGSGFAVGRDGVMSRVGPGSGLAAGVHLFGGPFLVEFGDVASPHSPATPPPVCDGPVGAVRPEVVGLAAFAITLVLTRSLSRAAGALLLLSRRAEILGREAADGSTRLRALRSGALPLRNDVVIRRPDLVLLDGIRIVSDGLEVATDERRASPGQRATIDLALSVAALAGSPWGPIRGASRLVSEGEGSFDGHIASAEIEGRRYELTPKAQDGTDARGEFGLVISSDGDRLGTVRLRPRLAADARELLASCSRHGIEVALSHDGRTASPAIRSLVGPVGITLIRGRPDDIARRESGRGKRIAVITDSADDGEALTHADLTIGLATGLNDLFSPPVDVLVPDLATAAAVLDAGARRDLAVRHARLLSSTANALGAAWVATGPPRYRTAVTLPNLATIVALLAAWLQLRGGLPPPSATMRLVDPRPERWGRRDPADVLNTLATSDRGLSTEEARARTGSRAPERSRESAFVAAVRDQLRSPLAGILAAGAVLSLATGALADVVLISAVIGLNALVGAVEARQAGAAAEALERMGQVHADVLRDGRRTRVAASELVPGDVLLLTSGDRIAADARVLLSRGLEVDEAALTGESFPVAKRIEGGSPAARIVLDGTDVTVGSGRAVVFAAGSDTRLGATAEALARAAEASPLDRRLHRMLFEVLPIAAGGGLLVILAGILWRRPAAAQLALGAGTAIAAVPEGLPLLSSLGQAAVARRLVPRRALVRRLSAIESLGRVNVACVDKTGTLTENRLRLQLVVAPSGARGEPDALPESLRPILRCAALASPPPGSSAHGTDAAVVEGAKLAGLDGGLDEQRTHEIPFDPARAFRGALVEGRACVKGSPEELVWRCTRVRRRGRDEELGDAGRSKLLHLTHELAEDGLRVLMVAEGAAATSLADPDDLVALGLLGIRDTVRSGAAAAIRDCLVAGIRPIMLTGDHPATASAIGDEIGLLDGGRVLTGVEIEQLSEEELGTALEEASVVARITPLEKLRIVEALQRRGYVVAMTGDGINDAPALRLADVGVAMGPSGTEVARQAADLVLADDDLTVFVDALIEGRTFWANLRDALAMLLGGNLGEVAFIVTLACSGFRSPLTARQILAINLASDVLPAISLVVQSPKRRELSRLAREGEAGLGPQLRREIFTRAAATATPALAAYALAHALLGPARAQSVGFASIVLTQLTQTFDAGRQAGRTSLATTAAVGGSVALLVAALHVRQLQAFLRLTAPGVLGWTLIGVAGATAPALSRALAANGRTDSVAAVQVASDSAAV